MKCLPLSQLKTAAEIFRDAADQERRLLSGSVKDPRQHRGGGGFAVRAGNHQHFLAAQKLVVQNLRQRTEGDALIENVLQFDVAAGDRVAHHHQVGRGSRFSAANGCGTGIPNEARKSDIGGYAAASEPVTRNPRCCSMPASDAMAVPQIPIK